MKLSQDDGRIAGSKIQAVRLWFEDRSNAGEYLTHADMRERFDLTAIQAKSIVYVIRKEGLIDSAVMLFKVPGA